MNGRKGQAAMEYLMTYGWALLVIVIVIAILLFLNPLQASPQCIFSEVGFLCNQPSNPVMDTSGKLYGVFTNGEQSSIILYGINCTKSKSTTAPTAWNAPAGGNKTLPRQDTFDLTLANVTCDNTSISKGATFEGRLWINWKYASDPASYPNRTSFANLVASVQ